MTLVFKVRGGKGENLNAFLESQHMGSCWAPISFSPVNAIIKATEVKICKSGIL